MPPALLPDPGPDDPGDDQSPEQGLYITLPAEQLTLSGFSQGGAADTMAPGALLATVVDTVTGEDGSGLAGCSDDQLMGIISAARRLESRAAWTLMAAIGEYARRAGTSPQGGVRRRRARLRAAHEPAVRRRADGLRHGHRQAAPEDLRCAARRADPI